MLNEQTSEESVQFAVKVSKGGANIGMRVLRALYQAAKEQKLARKAEKTGRKYNGRPHPRGKQTVKQLVGQDQGVTSVDISEIGIRDFDRYARRFGVDYAVLKNKNVEPPKYTVFFKAKDADAITSLIGEYTAAQLNRKEHPKASVRDKLHKFREIVAAIPRKVVEKRKERTL